MRTLRTWAGLPATIALSACLSSCVELPPLKTAAPASTAAPCEGGFGAAASFALDRAALKAKGASPHLFAKLDASAYRYFRALGRQYSARTCAGFRDVRWHLPLVAIHGDPHLEQFVVTPTTAALEDYDQAGYGPAVVDLVRYAASIHLACREVSFSCHADDAIAAYFRAYREALDHAPERKTPSIALRVRRSAGQSKEEWLAWADSLMQPLTAAQEARTRQGWAAFLQLLAEIRPDRPPEFYTIVRMGALQMGIGSALETKLLFRVRGATDAPADDLVIEARSTPPATGTECAWRPPHGGSLQPLMFMAILGPRMPETYGYATLDDTSPEFWVQAWEPGYRELSVSDIQSDAELVELAEEAGRQLAGHFWTRFPDPLRALQRHAQLAAFDLVNARARKMARDFAAETVVEWHRFRTTSLP